MLTVNQTPWEEVTAVSTVGSANIVFKFVGTGANDVLWVKGAPGLTRVQFANEAIGRLGLGGDSRVISADDVEHAQVVAKVNAAGDVPSKDKLNRLRTEKWGLLVMSNAGPTEYATHLDSKGGTPERVAEHLRLLGLPSIREDIARIIAADLLLGNFDRMAARANSEKFHGGNFLIDLTAGARFVPIDNDVVAPSFEHVITKRDLPATPEQLYSVVIHGGMLKDDNHAFPASEQSSISGLLGAGSADLIYNILNSDLPGVPFKGVDAYTEERLQIRQYAVMIAPLVKDYMRDLLVEVKNPGGQRQGLNELMKAQDNIEGMNYDTFKLKSRFATLMVDAQNLDPQEVERRAQAYQKYRGWKQSLVRLFAPVPQYAIPAVYKNASGLSFMGRGTDKLKSKTLTATVTEAHALKKDLRKGRLDEQQLRQEWENIKGKPDTEQSVVKAKVLCISKMLTFDLESRAQLLRDVLDVHIRQTWVDTFYRKAIHKRAAQCPALLQGFRTVVNVVINRLEEGKAKDEYKELAAAFKDFEALINRVPAIVT
jgi:hypothetical protein